MYRSAARNRCLPKPEFPKKARTIVIAKPLLVGIALWCLGAPMLRSQVAYSMVDLGVVPGSSGAGTTPTRMNAMGDCVGWSTVGSAPHAFLYTDEQGMVDLGNLPGNVSATARCLNDLRVVLGVLTWDEFSWAPPGGMTVFAPGFWSRPGAINNSGMVVGTLNPGGFSPRPFFYTPQQGVVQFAGPAWGHAFDVNESGTLVGDWGGTGGSIYNAATGSQPLPTLSGFPWNYPVAINDAGQVAGNASPVTGLSTWFRYTPGGGIVNIGTPGAWGGGVGAMNNFGDMVGFHNTTIEQAYLYTDAAGFQNLNAMVPSGSGYTLSYGTAINDAGQILCGAYNGSLTPSFRAVRLDPIARTAWASPVGTGCSSASPPTLTGSRPILGGMLSLNLTNAAPATAGILAASLGRPVPASFGPTCSTYVDLSGLLVSLPLLTDATGNAGYMLPVPMSTAFSGLSLTWQAALIGTNGPAGLDLSNALLMQLGN